MGICTIFSMMKMLFTFTHLLNTVLSPPKFQWRRRWTAQPVEFRQREAHGHHRWSPPRLPRSRPWLPVQFMWISGKLEFMAPYIFSRPIHYSLRILTLSVSRTRLRPDRHPHRQQKFKEAFLKIKIEACSRTGAPLHNVRDQSAHFHMPMICATVYLFKYSFELSDLRYAIPGMDAFDPL